MILIQVEEIDQIIRDYRIPIAPNARIHAKLAKLEDLLTLSPGPQDQPLRSRLIKFFTSAPNAGGMQ